MDIEQEIQAKGLTAPRITPADIEAAIDTVHYFTANEGVFGNRQVYGYDGGPTPQSLGLLTFCVLVLRNGFTVAGTSAVASPENFDADIGRKVARADAVRQVWPLLGYALRTNLHDRIPRIARVAHEVNRAYCQALGDTSQPAWEDAPQWQRDSACNGAALHLGNPEAGPQASHESWMAEKLANGWTYGPVKDPENKRHPCIVPFDQLPREQQAKDYLFRGIVRAMA